jgi:hypothetical protein
VNTFGINRPVYSFGLGLVLTLVDPGLPTDPSDVVTFYPIDSRRFEINSGPNPCPPQDLFCAIKDPTEKLYYNFDYTVIMETTAPADVIATSTWSIQHDDGSLVIEGTGHDDVKTNVHLTGGGRLGSLWRVINHITTTAGRAYERTIYLTIQAK